VFFLRLGEIRDRTFENQRYRASGLDLAVAAIILWNTVYLGRAVDDLRSRGERFPMSFSPRSRPSVGSIRLQWRLQLDS
jgi:TnpA family transposase